MNDDARLERILREGLSDLAPAKAPAALRRDVFSAIEQTEKRPRWVALVRVGPMRSRRGVAAGSPTVRLVLTFAVLTALLLAAAVALVLGGRLLTPPAPVGIFVVTGELPPEMGYLIDPALTSLADGRVLIVGGGQDLSQATVYDPGTRTYGPPIPIPVPTDDALPTALQGPTTTRLSDGRVLVAGGVNGATGEMRPEAYLFDPATDTFTATGPMSVARVGHTATLLQDGRVLIVGGYAAGGNPRASETMQTLAISELFDPSTGTFSPTGSLAQGRTGHTATLLSSGQVAVVGGYSGDGTGAVTMTPISELYDPDTETFRPGPSLVTARADHGALLLDDGRLLAVGGGRDVDPLGDPSAYLASAEMLDPATMTFRLTEGSLETERARPMLVQLPAGGVLVAGGRNGYGTPRSAAWLDPGSGTFRAIGMSRFGHADGQAVLLPDGDVLLGGFSSELFEPGVTVEPTASPSPSAPAATDPPGLTTPVRTGVMRRDHTATRLLDGRVLIVGGTGGDGNRVLASADLFDPASGLLVPTGSLSSPHMAHAAVLLPDGRVLVAGGVSSSTPTGPSAPDPSAEIYDPATGLFSPASDDLQQALVGFRILPLANGSGQRLLLLDEASQQLHTLDLETGVSSQPVEACYFQGGAVELPDGRILDSCGFDRYAVLYDPGAGTQTRVEGIDVDLEGPFRLADGTIVASSDLVSETAPSRRVLTYAYDLAQGSLRVIADDLETAPSAGVTAELPDGRLLVLGGVQSSMSDAIRILDPVTWAYTDVGHLTVPRADATATLLADGRVLVVGGAQVPADRSTLRPPSAEVVDITTVR